MKIPFCYKKHSTHDKRKLIPPQWTVGVVFFYLVTIVMSRILMTTEEMHLEDNYFFLVMYALSC